MDRSKIVAIVTGAIALLVSIAYLLLVQLIDFRGGLEPAPITGQIHAPHSASDILPAITYRVTGEST